MRYELVQIRSSPNFYVQWFEGGHSRRCSTRTRSRDEAEAFIAAFRLSGPDAPAGPVTVPDVLDWYLDTRGEQIKARATAEICADHLKRLFGSTLAEEAGLARQEGYAIARRQEGVSDSTISRELTVLSAALQRALKHERIGRAPSKLALEVAPPKERWLTRDEVAAIFAYFRRGGRLRQRHRTRHLLVFARLALYTGARAGAICGLPWDRVDLDLGYIDYAEPGAAHRSKRRSMVPLEPAEVRLLRWWRKLNPTSHIIAFRGKRAARIGRAFTNAMDELGLVDVTPNTLRHTFGTWAAGHGVPLYSIGGAMGHSNPSTTSRYAKHQLAAMRKVTSRVRRK